MTPHCSSNLLACLTGIACSDVLKRFSTPAYQAIDNIHHFSLPFRTRDDNESDIDFDDEGDIGNPPYPSYLWELAELGARQRMEVDCAVLAWKTRGTFPS